MLKKLTLVLSIFCIIILLGCEKDEIVVDESSPSITADKETDDTNTDEESKPLIAVSAKDTIQILVRADGAPGMYLGKDGKVHGFYVDLEKMIMKEMGQSYKFVPFSDVGPAAHGLKSGTYHNALAVPDVPDYRGFLNLSIPYEVLHYVIFVQNDNKDISGSSKEKLLQSLHGKKVGVQSQGHVYQILRGIKEIELIEYPTTTKALEDLSKGLLDAVPDVKRIGIYYNAKNNWKIIPVGVPIMSQKITTGISPVFETSLVDRYNKALKALISDGRFDKLYESYFGPMGEEDRP
ncbi:MAG: transporter substrate-binding domain-containing protein [Desulfobacteraceae bacterium]|nr:transporter substrate-binding domain-containing protein [Desulfobacteraceae bacterium]